MTATSSEPLSADPESAQKREIEPREKKDKMQFVYLLALASAKKKGFETKMSYSVMDVLLEKMGSS